MGFWGILGRGILEKVVKPELARVKDDLLNQISRATTTANQALKEVKDMRKQLTALQALDIGFHERGKVIVLAHINGKDRVKVIETKPEMSVLEYKDLAEDIKARYGARRSFVDAPNGADIRIV